MEFCQPKHCIYIQKIKTRGNCKNKQMFVLNNYYYYIIFFILLLLCTYMAILKEAERNGY